MQKQGAHSDTAAAQGDIWGARARDWAECNEPAWRTVFEVAMTEAGARSGKAVIDVGCGAGGALAIARALGATVAGLDAATNLVAIARERLPGARIEAGEMENSPFQSEGFDTVTAINALQFAGNPVRALSEMRRMARQGGSVLVLVWGRREECELVNITASVVFALLPPGPASPQVPWAEVGTIERMMMAAGLDPRGSGEFDGPLAFPDVETATRAVLSASARAIRHVGADTVERAIRATLPRVTQPDGTIVFRNRFRWVRAERPRSE